MNFLKIKIRTKHFPFNLCSEQFRRVFSKIEKDGEFHQCCSLSWNGNSPVPGRKRCEFYWSKQLTICPLVSKVAVELNMSYWQLDSLIFTFQFVVFLICLLLVLGWRVIMGAVNRTNEYVENLFLDPCIEKYPSKDFIVIPSFIEQIRSQS